jgi:hypothetical protein
MFENLVHVVNVLHFRMDRAFRTDFAAKAASYATTFFNSYLHDALLHYFEPPRARVGSEAQGFNRKSKTSSMGF